MRCLRRRSPHRLTHRHHALGTGDDQTLTCVGRWFGRTRLYLRAGGLDWTRVTREQFVSYVVRRGRASEEPS